jgi:hypothetical protein
VAFFVAAALLVGVIDRTIVGARQDVEAAAEDGAELEPGSR